MKLYKTKLALATSLIVASNVYAQNLPNVIVTAKPDVAEIEIDRFSSTSAVITDETLRDLHASDLSSALRNTPGTQITRYNPVGSFGGDQGGSIFIRGMGLSRPGSEIKTYIDNVPMYMPVWGHALLDLLPVNGMKDITIYKSPQPQINGNNFASINLNTKTAGPNNGVSGNARVSYGSYNTMIEQVDLAGRSNDVDFSLAQGFSKSNGARTNSSGQLANIMGSAGFKIDQNWKIGISGMALNNTAKDPGNNTLPSPVIAPTYDSNAQMVTAFAKHNYDSVEGEFRIYSNTGNGNLNNDLVSGGWGNSYNNFTMQGLRWKESITPWQGGNVLLGLDYDSSSGSVTSTPAFNGALSSTTTKTTLPTYKLMSPYMGVSHSFMMNNKWSLVPSAGVRNYQNNQYASKTAPYGGISLVSDVATIFFNASQGINYPGMEGPALQASIPVNWANQSWKNLSAEEMTHMELGGKFFIDKKTRVDTSLFQDTIKNRSVFTIADGPPFPPSATWSTYGQYTMQGVELSAQREFIPELTVFGGWTYLNNNSVANLPYVPQNAFNAAITGYLGKFRLSVDAQYQTSFYSQTLSRNTSSTNTTLVNGSTVANARVSYPIPELGKKGEVFVMVENIFNQQYSYRQGYPMPGTWGSVGLSASF
ncbi:ligand-gated channel [Polynucleobacter hirudinilacicola]|uniref:Ligand-gated channel n=1 Tax=Polynucleobacter hirudinilacicola TaxID=1743166 RepID=A0A210RYF5_9BURK|nr:TonB-dependent receptor [Polynucleobacter hirudinilacicola]OWF66026.1 ligand-gated channel [Polynucleobacter hirudinilacicola]